MSWMKRKRITMTVTASIPKTFSIRDARREAVNLIKFGTGWSYSAGEILQDAHVTKVKTAPEMIEFLEMVAAGNTEYNSLQIRAEKLLGRRK